MSGETRSAARNSLLPRFEVPGSLVGKLKPHDLRMTVIRLRLASRIGWLSKLRKVGLFRPEFFPSPEVVAFSGGL